MRIHASINRMVNKEDSAIKAYASVTMDGMFAVHGLRVIETEKGRFVNMPSTSYTDKDGNKQYSDTFHAITKSARTAVNQAVLNAYDLKLQQVQQTDIEVENTPDEEMSEPEDEPEPELSMQFAKAFAVYLVTKVELLQKVQICGRIYDILLDKERDDMKRAIYISILCTVMLTACGNVSESTKSAETSDVSQTAVTVTSAKEEMDTSKTTTTIKKISQTVSSSSKLTDTEVTAVKKSSTSKTGGNSVQGQNNAVQGNNQAVQNNTPSNNSQDNNLAEQNAQPSNEKSQNNEPSATQSTTAKPSSSAVSAVTNPPDTTTKPQTTKVPQTQPPLPVPTEEERYMDIGRSLSHNGSDYSKAEAVYNWMTENGSGTCVNYSWQTYYLCKGTDLECYLAWTPSKLYGHVANVVKVNGTWFVFDTQGGRFLKSDKYGDITQIFDENDNTIELSVSESAY